MNGDVSWLVTSLCDIETVFQLRMTSKQHFDIANSVLRMRFNDLVRPFIPQVDAFSEILLKHGAVISGSLALYYFIPGAYWYPRDIDIYVSHSQFTAFACARETDPTLRLVPYTQPITPSWDSDEPWDPSESLEIADVRKYITPTGRHMDVIQSRQETPLSPLRDFWTSLLANFVTPNGCGSAYPRLMFAGCGYVQDSPMTPRDKAYLITYMATRFKENCGFQFLSESWGTWKHKSHWQNLEDYFCDQTGLVVHFGMRHQDSSPSLPVQPLSDGWKLIIPFPMGAYCTRLIIKLVDNPRNP